MVFFVLYSLGRVGVGCLGGGLFPEPGPSTQHRPALRPGSRAHPSPHSCGWGVEKDARRGGGFGSQQA